VTGPPRDWDKEMAEIDKLIAKQPTAAPSGQGSVVRGGPAALPAPQRAAAPPVARGGREALGTWVKVLLGAGVATAVAFYWPYAHGCGLQLYGYVAAAAGVMVVGLWGVVASWKARMGLAHLIALLSMLLGGALIAKTVLDRSSYPKVPSTWRCG
jgi:hypothetical protein